MKKMELWNKLEKTNPDHTKSAPSSYGKKITTIDAMHQIKNMTEEFGPVEVRLVLCCKLSLHR